MSELTECKTIRFNKTQMNSLKKLEAYNVNVSTFIRQAIKEKISCDWKSIKEKKTKEYTPFN